MQRKAIRYERPIDGRSETATSTEPATFIVLDTVTDEGGPAREALAGALELLAAGDAAVLLTPRLRGVAGSLREVVALIDWLAAADADLVAIDVDLDTGTEKGRALVALLREIEGWDRARESGRSPRGRPGLLEHRPELAERIVALREEGLSLQRIADLLNADGVATPRGGAQWRPSSVQAALGYRRPSPPVPGVPRPGRGPKPPPHGPGHAPHPPPPRGDPESHRPPPRHGPDS
jgi:hypothetical protein